MPDGGGMSRFEPVDGRSELALEGESSIHPLHTATTDLKGYFEATLNDAGQLDLSAPVSGQVEMLVESMKSNNVLIDREMQKRLNTRRYPRVVAELVAVEQRSGMGHYRAAGDLTFHGVTKRLEDELILQQIDEIRLKFGVKPRLMSVISMWIHRSS
jgi:hypothetical protein